MVENIPDMEAILAQMKEGFLETAHEKLDRMEEILQMFASKEGGNDDLQEEFLRDVHSLKGLGGTFQMPLVTKICHALEEYLEGETELSGSIVDNALLYVDRIVDLIESDEGKYSNWLEGLAHKNDETAQDQVGSEPLVLLACSDKNRLSVLNKAFSENDFQVISTASPYEAFEIAIGKKPVIIVISQTLGAMDGADLLRCLSASRALSRVKFAMICPDRRKALDENLHGVQLLSEKNIEIDIFNFIAIAITG